MADNGALPLLRPFLLRPSLHICRFRNPRFFPSSSHLLYLSTSRVKIIPLNRRRFSYKISAVTEEGGRTERRKRGRKRRELWEELFEDNVEDDDDDEFVRGGGDARGKSDLWKILEEIVDNVWILKAFRSYGYLLPFIIISLFFSTGPKAFLISLGIAIGPSLLFLAFKKLTGWDKRRKASIANQFGIDEEEEYEVERRGRSRVRYSSSQVRNNVNGRGINREMAASEFGGWDELDRLGNIREQPRNEPERKPMRKRKRVRRREESAEPLLLRLLVSFTNMIKK